MLIDSKTSPDQAVLVVHVADQRFGLPLASVERVVPMAYVQRLPGSSNGFIGALNIHGDVLPVVDPRPRLGLSTPQMLAEHCLVLVAAESRFLIWVDLVDDVVADATGGASMAEPGSIVSRVMRLQDALLPVLSPAALDPRLAA
jgi:chemotaxis signal transduction protein